MPNLADLLHRFPLAIAFLALFVPSPSHAGPPGYDDYAAFHSQAESLAESERVSLSSLGQTAGGRDVVLLTLSGASPQEASADTKPAILILGSVEAGDLVGSHLAMEIVRGFVERAKDDDAVAKLLDKVTLYIVPRPSPDASERLFAEPLLSTSQNNRPTDDDWDGEVDEDPPEDLNGDGLITAMRVADEAGAYIQHPDEPRLLIKADATKDERGAYRLLSEGIDNDGDQQWNEDPPGGVDFNCNFTFRYPYFQPGAGPHQVSEPETRSIADFAYDHPNIFLVFSFAPEDNLRHPWKAKSSSGRIKRSVQAEDAKYLDRLAKIFSELSPLDDVLPSAKGEGAFVPWAYYHFGRWSVATRGWQPPEVSDESGEQKQEDESADADGSDEDQQDSDSTAEDKPTEAKRSDSDDRGKQGLRALRWLDSQGDEGFVAWTKIDHPDFPGQLVEVGGFHPGARLHPPVDDLDAAPVIEFLSAVAEQRARIDLLSVDTETLGEGVFRVSAQVINRGQLPTASKMGELSRQLQRLGIRLTAPDGVQMLAGPAWQAVGVLAPGEAVERTWLLLASPEQSAIELKLRVGEPSVGFAEARVTLNNATNGGNNE